jgi:uncharacterized protein YoxC
MDGAGRGPSARFAGPPTGVPDAVGGRPATLMEVLSRRIVDALKSEIALATAEVHDIGSHTTRMEEQLEHQLGQLEDRLGRIEELLAQQPSGADAVATTATPVEVTASVDRSAVIEAVEEAMAGARAVITNAVDRRLEQFEAFIARTPAPASDSGFDPAYLFDVIEPTTERVLAAIADVHVAVAGLPAPTTTDSEDRSAELAEVRAELQRLREEVEAARDAVQRSIDDAVAGRPDPTPVLDVMVAQAAELQVTVVTRLDDLERALGAQPDPLPAIEQLLELVNQVEQHGTHGIELRPLLNEIGAKLAEVHGSLIGRLVDLAARVTELPDVRPLHDELVRRLDGVQAGVERGPDFAPLLDELGARLAETRGAIHGRIDELAGDVAGVRDAVVTQPDVRPLLAELGSRLDTVSDRLVGVRDTVAAGPDFAPVVGEIGVRLAELRAEIASWIGGVVDGVAGVEEHLSAAPDYAPLLDGMATRLGEVRTALRSGIDELRAASSGEHVETRETFERALDDVRMAIALSQEAAELGRESAAARMAGLAGHVDHMGNQLDHMTGRVEDVFGRIDNVTGRVEDVFGRIDNVTGRVEEVFDRIDDVTEHVDSVGGRVDTVDTAIRPMLAELEDRLAGVAATLHGRLDEMQDAAQATGRELFASIEQLGERAAAAITAAHVAEAEARAALATQLADVHAAVQAGPDLGPVLDAVAGAREAVALVVDAVTAAHHGDLHAIETSRAELAQLVDQLTNRVAAVQHAVGEGVDLEPLAERVLAAVEAVKIHADSNHAAIVARTGEVESAMASAAERLGTELAAVRAITEAGIDLTPVSAPLATGMASLERAVADVRSLVVSGPDLTPVTTLLGEVAGLVQRGPDFTPVTETLRAAFTAMIELGNREPDLTPVTRRLADIERLLRALDVSIETGSPAIQGAAMAELTQAVHRLQSDVVGHAEEIGHTVAGAVGDAVAVLRSEVTEVGQVLGAQVRAARTSGDDSAQIARRLEVIEAALFDVAGLLGQPPAPAMPAGPDPAVIAQIEAALARQAVTVGDLTQEVRVLLADNRRAVDGRLQEVVQGLGTIAQEIRGYASMAAATPGMEELTEGANETLARLERMAEAVLVRMERRHGELAAGTAELEGAFDRSADRIVAQVGAIAEALESSERVVRERFVELETAMSEVRGDAAQIRSVRSGIEAIGNGLEVVRGLVGQVAGSSDVSRVANGVVEITNELRATVERLGDLDRRFAVLRSEVGESNGIARATFKAASSVGQLGEELEEIRQRLDLMVASLVSDDRFLRAIGPGEQPR